MPDVMASQTAPVLVTVSNVPIVEAGVEYALSTGPATFTPEDLRDAVTAENEDQSIPSPRLKIGHIDARYNDRSKYDGTPAFGKATNLRLSENGMVVYADFVGVPKWLADIMPAAYPSRSIEGYWNVTANSGKEWGFVISAVSLLGIEWPGVTRLEDLPLYYGSEMPEEVQIVTAASGQGGDPIIFKKKASAAANLDDVRREFYSAYVEDNPGAYWWWIRAVLISPNELIVEDDEDGQLYRIPFDVGASGEVSFGDPSKVRIEYVDQPESAEARKAAATFVAAGLVADREVLASWSTRADSCPARATGGGMDPALEDLRNRLGLPEDTPEAKLQEIAATVSNAVGGTSPSPDPSNRLGTPVVQPVGTGDNNNDVTVPPVPTPVAASAKNEDEDEDDDGDEDGVVKIDAETFERLKAGAAAGLQLSQERDRNERQTLVAAAISDGRIPPARREYWESYIEKDPQGGKEALASLTPGLVPVDEIGLNSGDEATTQGPAYPTELFPELTRRQQHQQALAAAGMRSRVAREEGVR